MLAFQQTQAEQSHILRMEGGRWLKQAREAAGLTQRQLAECLHLEYYSFISQIEAGRGRVPADRYETWARALKLEPAAFVRALMRYYDPATYEILFGDPDTDGADGS